MSHLTPAQRETLRARLNARSRQLRGELDDALHAPDAPDALGLPNHRDEVDDDAVAELETGLELAGIERDEAELNAVLAALARMDAGHYGLCADCAAPLSLERLLAQPQALRCVRCETERERVRARPSLPAL